MLGLSTTATAFVPYVVPYRGFLVDMAGGRGSIRLKREPDYWEVRAYAGRDPATGKHRYVSRTVRGGKRDAQKLLASLTTELQTHGPTTRHTVNELLTAHVDHLEARGRQDRTIDPSGCVSIQPNRLTQAWNRLRRRVPGAENMRLHDLRHWYASTQLDAGEPLPAVAARIGDHVETLAKVYAHKGHRGDQKRPATT